MELSIPRDTVYAVISPEMKFGPTIYLYCSELGAQRGLALCGNRLPTSDRCIFVWITPIMGRQCQLQPEFVKYSEARRAVADPF